MSVADLRFTTAPCIDGVEVVGPDGRAVARRKSGQAANGVAFFLNGAVKDGPKALIRAFEKIAERDHE